MVDIRINLTRMLLILIKVGQVYGLVRPKQNGQLLHVLYDDFFVTQLCETHAVHDIIDWQVN